MSRTEFSTEQRARWRWLLYVALAFAGGLLTFVGARAQATETQVRYTGIWEKRGANWLLVHEHLSTPMGD